MKKSKKRSFEGVFWGIAILFLSLSIAILVTGQILSERKRDILTDDFFALCAKRESPKFYAYDFRDRTNRIGEMREITDEVYAEQSRIFVPYEKIPQAMKDAFVAIEDKRFYRHRGVDWIRTASAGVNYLFHGSKRYGASTVTQQLVKNLTGENQVTADRKVREIMSALELERTLDKSEILELYLNVIPFSDNRNGIGEAAAYYFGKEPMELTVAQCASIAAVTNSPAFYDPIRHPDHNLQRRNLILSEMAAQGYLSEEEYARSVDEPLVLSSSGTGKKRINSWYADMAIEDVIGDLMREKGMTASAASAAVYSGGLCIELAVDPSIQEYVEDYYQNVIRVPKNKEGTSAQSALIVIHAETGDILGVAGAVGEKKGNRLQNFATRTKRPPGSSIKPISVYAPALEAGIANWASVYDDVPVNFGADGGTPWPQNATREYRGLTNVAFAVAHSTNTVAVRILEQVGIDKSFQTAKEKFHLESLVDGEKVSDRDYAALALGQLNYGATLREMTNAYTVFADGGTYHPYRSYYRVLAPDGTVLLSRADAGESVLSPGNAAVMTKLMEGVITDGTSSSITLNKTVECAGKTGTSSGDFDRWFIGYTPDFICGVWCGYEYPEALEGRNLCTSVWNDVMREIVRRRGERTVFSLPASVVRATYCRDSGQRIDDACTCDPRGDRSQEGYFVKGTEPKHSCTRHVMVDYDAIDGGVLHEPASAERIQKTALLRIERHFPVPIFVTDAQYVYGGDPFAMQRNPNGEQPYFGIRENDYCGVSSVRVPYHRSSPYTFVGDFPPEEIRWLPRRFLTLWKKDKKSA